MARIHLLVGPVGAGKSTLAIELARLHRAVWLNLDEWMAELFRPDRPDTGVLEWYVERVERCIAQLWRLTEQLLDVGTNVVLELGLIRRDERGRFFERVALSGHDMTVHVVDLPREVRRLRVERRNREEGRTFSMLVPPAIFELASDLWEPLDDEECAGREVHFVKS
jgi:predicted kinase